jgi:hypothetical protein
MKTRASTFAISVAATTSTLISSIGHAHPGHEPENLFHVIAHALMSPRAIIFLLIAGAAVVAWRCYAKDKSE